jgi:hypothetical protein
MGSNTPKKNRIDQTTAEQTLIDGFNKHGASIASMAIGGTTTTPKDIVATLQSRIDSAHAVLSTRATWQAAVRTDRTVRATTKTFVSGVKQGLLLAFAGKLDVLADFGLTGRASPVISPEQKLAAAAKAKATRAARHTMGTKQKAAIKGTVSPTAPAVAGPSAPVLTAPSVAAPAAPTVVPTSPAITAASSVMPPTPPVTPVASVVAPVAPATPVVTPVVSTASTAPTRSP